MVALSDFRSCGEEIEKRLRLKTFPLALKMLEREKDIPEGAVRPVRDLGYHLALCQGFAKSRKEGTLLAMLKDDMWCPEPVIGYGLAEPPQYFLDGHNRYPSDAKTLEIGSIWAHDMPRLEVGRYIGLAFAPLRKINFEPDVVVVYCNPAQLTQMLIAVNRIEGYDVRSQLSGHAGCVYYAVPALRDRKFNVASPCAGDRMFAMAQDDELVFTFPKERIEEFIEALRYLDEFSDTGRLPFKSYMMPEIELDPDYTKIGRMLGMDMHNNEL